MGCIFIWIPIVINVCKLWKWIFVLHALCISICVCLLLFINMLIELSFDFRGHGVLKCVPFSHELRWTHIFRFTFWWYMLTNLCETLGERPCAFSPMHYSHNEPRGHDKYDYWLGMGQGYHPILITK
jgi:hypothetical protein